MILMGSPATKRTDYFLKAARELGIEVRFKEIPMMDRFNDFKGMTVFDGVEKHVVKIDPPKFSSYLIDELPDYIMAYERWLWELSADEKLFFVNRPEGILQVLDKLACKKRLSAAGLSVTPLVVEQVKDYFSLKEVLLQRYIHNVFIKLNKGSGACGIIAYRFHPQSGRVAAYTALAMQNGRLVNMKRLRKMTQEWEIAEIINALSNHPVLVERWIPKEAYQGRGYDLRVVYQFGRMAYVVARLSDGPITNLHLNNKALLAETLGLTKTNWEEINNLCGAAMACYCDNLHYAGIDILLEKDSRKPYIVEMNGQGDLLYQDIYHENLIYKMQLKEMMKLESC